MDYRILYFFFRGDNMIKRSIKHLLTAVLFLLLASCMVFFHQPNADAQFGLFNPYLYPNLLGQLFSYPGLQNISVVAIPQANYTQAFSYQDYYADYPYLQLSNSSPTSGYGNSSSGNYTPYITNISDNSGYILGPTVSTNVPVVYNQQYQGYYPLSSSGYAPSNQGIYTGYPSAATNYAASNGYSQYQTSNYFPSNAGTVTYPQSQTAYSGYYIPYTSSAASAQGTYSGYYVPNANYWPNAEVTDTDTDTSTDTSTTDTSSTNSSGYKSCGGSMSK
ncbi:hypothetical protein JXL19_05820 [bacterium]|nr:hypothetical protein [bacterium]